MTQDSWPWNCSPLVGDAGAVTVNDLVNAQQFGANTQPNSEGVVYWTSTNPLPGGSVAVDGLLEPSLAGDVVTIASGVGMVQGWNYVNTADVDFDFAAAPGNANATDLIVLERGDPTSTLSVRLARVQGAASTVATVTQSEALWQVAIAQVALDGSGLPTSITDVRRFVNQVMSWRQGASSSNWTTPGTTNYLVGNVEMQSGSISATMGASFNFVSFPTVTFPKQFVNSPLVFVHLSGPGAAVAFVTTSKTITNATAQWGAKTSDGDALLSDQVITAHWLAIGLELA